MLKIDRAARKTWLMAAVQISVLTLAVITAAVAGEQSQTAISIRALPPEAIPVGTCTSTTASYLVIGKGDKPSDYKLSDKQIGEYVRIRMAQGYSVELYPQDSGKIYVVATCHATKR
jgi:hypothetical protein